ncbi:thioesterase domain-containing protein [Mycobacterium arosiense]|uniref:thioesterase domain-containing protein n=1 Tax=Mycobacterium arosiense TaxID=425468 RepID=UPI003F67A937
MAVVRTSESSPGSFCNFDRTRCRDPLGTVTDQDRIDRLADDLAEVLTALRVTGPLTLAGHCMGGMTALAYLGRPAAPRTGRSTG